MLTKDNLKEQRKEKKKREKENRTCPQLIDN